MYGFFIQVMTAVLRAEQRIRLTMQERQRLLTVMSGIPVILSPTAIEPVAASQYIPVIIIIGILSLTTTSILRQTVRPITLTA